jgi:hypothetical protein
MAALWTFWDTQTFGNVGEKAAPGLFLKDEAVRLSNTVAGGEGMAG